MRKFETLTIAYDTKERADKECLLYKEKGYTWFTGWEGISGYFVEYRKYI